MSKMTISMHNSKGLVGEGGGDRIDVVSEGGGYGESINFTFNVLY